jgi:hypothetical protein
MAALGDQMASRQKLRWAAILCNHAISNIACYRGGWNGKTLLRTEEFWKRANGNFLDIAVLEWCKLFAEPKGAHGWRKILSDPTAFEVALLAKLGISHSDLDDYCVEMRTYRDKFVAHLDDNGNANYPTLDLAIGSTKFLYSYLLSTEDKGGYFVGLPCNPEMTYRSELSNAKNHYGR